jgi:hypothetical protein
MDDELDTAARDFDHRVPRHSISDVTPGTKGGYVLRKIMRRAMRHEKYLGLHEPFLHRFVAVLAREMGDAHPAPRESCSSRTRSSPRNRFATVWTGRLASLSPRSRKCSRQRPRLAMRRSALRTFGPLTTFEDTAATQIERR